MFFIYIMNAYPNNVMNRIIYKEMCSSQYKLWGFKSLSFVFQCFYGPSRGKTSFHKLINL